MQNMISWIKNSNLKFSIDLNPFVWSFKGFYQAPTRTDPHLRIIYVRILPLSIAIILDNGKFNTDWSEQIVPIEGTGKDSL